MITEENFTSEVNEIVAKLARIESDVRERAIRQFLPDGMSEQDSIQFLKNSEFEYRGDDLYGLGRKLGTILKLYDLDSEDGGITIQFEPNPDVFKTIKDLFV